MIIPREDGLVRISPDTILEAAQRIIKPYKLEYKHRDWWTVYQVSRINVCTRIEIADSLGHF